MENRNHSFFAPRLVLGLGIPWYIRNWMVTGNPVYAFFPEIFGGKHINPEVLASCYKEWAANGIGVPGATIFERITNAPKFFFYDWRFAPVLLGLAFPGIVLGLIKSRQSVDVMLKIQKQFISLILVLLGLGFFYHLIISSLYLYQIIFIILIFKNCYKSFLRPGFDKWTSYFIYIFHR